MFGHDWTNVLQSLKGLVHSSSEGSTCYLYFTQQSGDFQVFMRGVTQISCSLNDDGT